MNIKLFVFDLDGTALGGHNPYDRFPAKFVQFLDGLSRQGIVWATNTTWSIETQLNLIRASGVKSTPAFLAGSTGRNLARVTKRGIMPDRIYERWIKSLDRLFSRRYGTLLRRLAARLLNEGLLEELYFNPYGQPSVSLVFNSAVNARRGWAMVDPLLKSGDVYRMAGVNKADTILPRYVNKGAVVIYMQKRLGISAAEILVAGDGRNDKHMFQSNVAGFMVCPANAHSSIKMLVRKNGGVVSRKSFSWGIIEAAKRLTGV